MRQRFLIVCEGEKTEPAYFRKFQVPGLVIHIKDSHLRGRGLIAYTEKLRDTDDYDQVWCVFDRDDLLASQIDAAFQQAKHSKIQIAFTNQAFELWYLLHFDFHNTAITRQDYIGRLSKKIGQEYQKTSTNIYDQLLSRQEIALTNAKRLLNLYQPWRPSENDPSTNVHLLVEELLRHSRP